jgi:hypothetical protein
MDAGGRATHGAVAEKGGEKCGLALAYQFNDSIYGQAMLARSRLSIL